MNEIASSIAHKRWRAPREDGESLFDPPLADEAAFLAQNLALQQQAEQLTQTISMFRMDDLRSSHVHAKDAIELVAKGPASTVRPRPSGAARQPALAHQE